MQDKIKIYWNTKNVNLYLRQALAGEVQAHEAEKLQFWAKVTDLEGVRGYQESNQWSHPSTAITGVLNSMKKLFIGVQQRNSI